MKNKVELLGYYGSDETIACSAWTSTSRDLTENKRGRINKLIDMLWREGHETPFEKGVVHFLVNTDIASHIHLLKHRITSLNAESARYKELLEDKYYIPEEWRDISVSDKNARVDDDGSTNLDWATNLERYTRLGNRLYHACVKDLEPILGRKRTKESARFFKTYNSQIEADVMFNIRSFANFIKLRLSEHAQSEIKEVAQEMWRLVENIEGRPFQHTLEAINARIQSSGR